MQRRVFGRSVGIAFSLGVSAGCIYASYHFAQNPLPFLSIFFGIVAFVLLIIAVIVSVNLVKLWKTKDNSEATTQRGRHPLVDLPDQTTASGT